MLHTNEALPYVEKECRFWIERREIQLNPPDEADDFERDESDYIPRYNRVLSTAFPAEYARVRTEMIQERRNLL